MMEKVGRIALLCLFITYLNCVQSSRYEGSTDCDFVRSSYIQLEQSLWEKYVDKVSLLSRNDRLYKIFNQHYMFIQQHMNTNYDQDFNILARFYEWNIIESDVKSVHALFKDHFRQRLETELEANGVNGDGFDERASLDLAETVLTDPLWPVNATIEKIQSNIYNQGLYYKAKSVRAPSKSFEIVISYQWSVDNKFQLTTFLCTFRKHQSHCAHHRDLRSKFSTNFIMQLQ